MIGAEIGAREYMRMIERELEKLDFPALERLSDLIYEIWKSGGTVFVCGNGGSAAFCSHLVQDLCKGTNYHEDLNNENRRRLKAVALTDSVPAITAYGNDLAYDQVFVQQLIPFGRADDLLIAVSGSGNSPNVLNAVDWADRHGMMTYGLSGFEGGKLKSIQKDGLHIELDDMGAVEAIHSVLAHWLVDDLLGRTSGTGKYAKLK